MSFSVDDARSQMFSKKEVTEETPFGPEVLVYKVLGKMFATIGFENEVGRMNLKCDPDRALELRDEYEAIIPGYHMNKKHWNTVEFETGLEDQLLTKMVDHSYGLVVQNMPKRLRDELEKL